MNPVIAARIFVLLTAGAVVFQIALAAGLPWGAVAWGGAFPGVLPPHMRIASLGSVFLLGALAFVVLVRAGIVQSRWKGACAKLVWFVVAYCGLGVLANSLTPSFWERVIWVPVTVLLFATSLIVARSR